MPRAILIFGAVVRGAYVSMGALSFVWCLSVLPAFRAEYPIVDIGNGILTGKSFAPQVLNSAEKILSADPPPELRSSVLGLGAVVRLRAVERAVLSGDGKQIDDR